MHRKNIDSKVFPSSVLDPPTLPQSSLHTYLRADSVIAAARMPSMASSYGVYPTYPPASLWSIDPSSKSPSALSPPIGDHSVSRPFTISPQIYNNALHAAVPITIAALYAAFVSYANQYNKKREFKPTEFSKGLVFYILVVLHNTFLAMFSAWVFIGIFTTIRSSWPGWRNPSGLAGVADALCKINGPRGLGSAATYNASTNSWGFTDLAMTLIGGNPDTTDVGRIWNEGLAFYGWFFYLSKFYEIMDTMIILAKGKRSSFLQTYHHAGAMICMWAGIRYMSPPIWMFTFINSGLHTLMVSLELTTICPNVSLTGRSTPTTLYLRLQSRYRQCLNVL